ncbi:membrane protein insertion efficiency factor YidD [Marinilabilia rubra]|uniref:Membrane protein insertion efficiency factor YidD n=1 Tax=Marinilabilia rubra TaxID=2162893 RepID=A0A2U2B7V4_9BACT|nr:membrane protein insertion efficiency factor YidD [Marinilabilia rubra]PWD99135.1 membrane protein insertion efficiency factor YidD [Marinilabilia rubra]
MPRKLIFKIPLIIIFLRISVFSVSAQNKLEADLLTIQSKETVDLQEIKDKENRKREFLIKKEDPLIEKINPIKLTLGSLLYIYQTSISKHFSADCLYEPSCSNFSRDVISHFGVIKGVFLTADRLTRCNRIAQTSLHPLSIDPCSGHSADSFTKYQFKPIHHHH